VSTPRLRGGVGVWGGQFRSLKQTGLSAEGLISRLPVHTSRIVLTPTFRQMNIKMLEQYGIAHTEPKMAFVIFLPELAPRTKLCAADASFLCARLLAQSP
jgi:hypothetical protein